MSEISCGVFFSTFKCTEYLNEELLWENISEN